MLMLGVAALCALVFLVALAATGRLRDALEEMPTGPRRAAALALLWGVLTACVFYPTVAPGEAAAVDPATIWFPSIFIGQAVLSGFLFAWWVLAGRAPLRRFLRLEGARSDDVYFGLRIGLIGWGVAIAASAIVALLLLVFHYTPSTVGEEPFEVPELLVWLTELPVSHKLIVVAIAMTVEEAFYRAFLQTRIGWVLSSVLFALSHGGYGLPTLTASVFAVSLAIGWALRQRGNLVPCIVAHGVFDAVQLLIIMPLAIGRLRELG